MSTLMSTDMNINRPSTRVRASPGGATTICFGDEYSSTPTKPSAAAIVEEATAVNSSEWKSMDYLTVPSSSKLVGIALAAHVGAENITTSIGKALAARGITNVVISLIEEPSILPFLAKSLAETCDVVLAVAVLGADEKNMANLLKQQLVEAGLVCACPIIPGIMTPGNLLELKALLPACTNTWCNSVSSILAIRDGAQPIAITAIIHEDVLAKAGTVLGPVSEDVSDLDHLLTDFRESMKSHGARGICGIGRKFRIMDDNNSKTLDIGEFTKGVSEHTLSWNTTQIKAVFDFFDQEKNGQISYDEFLVALRGPLNEKRKQFVYLAFEILDKDKNGVIETKDLVGVYDGSKHPDVIAGKKTQEDVLREFLDTFDVSTHAPDGKVTPVEFMNYYSNVSSSIDDDDYFELMMRNAWHISGGEGWCANSSCVRVLCTHADGHQTVEEMKNDLGMKKGDKAAMMANLTAQGITTVVDIATTGTVDNTTPPASAAGPPGKGAGSRVETEGAPKVSSVSNSRRAPGGQATLVLG